MSREWGERYVACARQHGADAELLPGGGIRHPYAEGREVSPEGLDAECVQQVGRPPAGPEPTPEFLRGLYRLYVKEAQCLRAHGYVIAEPPSEASWVDSYGSESWMPLADVMKTGRDVVEAERLCPQPDPAEAERAGRG